MSSEDPTAHMTASGVTINSDSEHYSAGDDNSPSPETHSSSSSPLILYKPPTVWGLVRAPP
ncbi:hypothetical protein PG994_014589 [Apiospora phragmitis]|uniref:Uncharacterized protein n=1 Tax=Apiospora phragmitis TaxID=2905665 RepID=A0ABR1T4S4_9PEZI